MISRLPKIRFAWAVLILGTWTNHVASQSTSRPSTMMVLRQEWGSLADEIVDKLQHRVQGTVWLSIQPTPDSGLAENAFLEVMQRRGFAASVKSRGDSAEEKLAITVLTDRAQFREIGPAAYERTVQTDVEARTEGDGGRTVTVLGMFHRTVIDTVSARDHAVLVHRAREADDEGATLFQRFVGPLIVLAGGIMIVYLFFTVRS